MKPKRVPGPAGKDPGLVPDGRPPGGGADGGALPLLHPGPGHSGGGVPRRHRAHPGGDGGGCGQRPLYLSQNHRAWMVTPFRLGLFYDWRNNGQPPDGDRQVWGPGGRHRRGTPLLGRQQRSVPVPPFRLCGPARRRLRGGPAAPIRPRPPSTPLWNSPPPSPRPEETAGYFWETVTLPGGTTYLHPDQLMVLDQAGHPLCTYDLTNHWGYASYPPLGNEVIDMTPYRDYTQAVCSCLRHATAEEKQAVAQELQDHLADHADALVEAGWDLRKPKPTPWPPWEEAKEVGQALDQTFPRRWLVLSRVNLVLAILVALVLFFPLTSRVEGAVNNLIARTDPFDSPNHMRGWFHSSGGLFPPGSPPLPAQWGCDPLFCHRSDGTERWHLPGRTPRGGVSPKPLPRALLRRVGIGIHHQPHSCLSTNPPAAVLPTG